MSQPDLFAGGSRMVAEEAVDLTALHAEVHAAENRGAIIGVRYLADV